MKDKKISDYTLIRNDSKYQFEEEIKNHLNEGWILHEKTFIEYENDGFISLSTKTAYYCQAMIK